MTAAMTRPGPNLLLREFAAGRADRPGPRPAFVASRSAPALYARNWASQAASTARLTIGQPPRPRFFEHETILS